MKRGFWSGAATPLVLLGTCAFPCFGAFAQAVSSLGNNPGQEQLCSVAGQVLRADINTPLKKARIELTDNADPQKAPYVALTDSEGQFKIDGIRPSRYDMEVQHDGYETKLYGEDDSGSSPAVLALNGGQSVTGLVFHLQRFGVITGRVLDEDGDAVQGATVEVVARPKAHRKPGVGSRGLANTNDLGEYRIFGLRPGVYLVLAHPAYRGGQIFGKFYLDSSTPATTGSYGTTYYPNASEFSRASTIELKAGDEIPGVDIFLQRTSGHKIRGTVFNAAVENPKPIADVHLEPKGDDGDPYVIGQPIAVNRESGEFEVSGVPDGTYEVAAYYRQERVQFVGTTSVVVAGADVDSVRVVITRGAEVHGRLIWEGTAPGEASLELTLREGRGFNPTALASDGTFSITGLRDGFYQLRVFSSCEHCYLKSATAHGVDLLESGLQVASGSAPSPIDLVYSNRTGSVEGVVIDGDGLPARGARVLLVWNDERAGVDGTDWQHFQSEFTDQYSHFVFSNVPPGNYHAYAFQKFDRENDTDPDFLKRIEQKAAAFSISESEKKTIQVPLLAKPDATQ